MDFSCQYGIVVPGVSSTIILMLLGIYSIYLTSVSNLYLPVLLPLSIGVILGSLCFMKLTKYLLEHFYTPTFYSIIGFTVGSIFVLLPSFSSSIDIIIGILSCLLRFQYSFYPSNVQWGRFFSHMIAPTEGHSSFYIIRSSNCKLRYTL